MLKLAREEKSTAPAMVSPGTFFLMSWRKSGWIKPSAAFLMSNSGESSDDGVSDDCPADKTGGWMAFFWDGGIDTPLVLIRVRLSEVVGGD